MAVGLTCLLVAFGFFYSSGVDALVVPRVQGIPTVVKGHDTSFSWRVQKWRGAAVMALRRPVWGWGPGQFVLHQSSYTHLGAPGEASLVRGPWRDGPDRVARRASSAPGVDYER